MELEAAARCHTSTNDWQLQMRASVQQLKALWQLRLHDRVPFQYLIHAAHWRDLVLSVGPGILIPRPETELIVDLAAAAVAYNPDLAVKPWADLGCGSGAVTIGLARMLQQQQLRRQKQQGAGQAPVTDACVWAVDLSPVGVAYATANAARCGVAGSVQACQGSWFEPLQQLQGQLGGVLSNPPYIPHEEMAGLQAEVGRHEPWGALDGGREDGTDSLRAICNEAAAMLAPGGFLALETAGNEQAYLVQKMLQQLQASRTTSAESAGLHAFRDVVVHDDCYGVPRFVTASRV
eukprot:gene1556-1896_t